MERKREEGREREREREKARKMVMSREKAEAGKILVFFVRLNSYKFIQHKNK